MMNLKIKKEGFKVIVIIAFVALFLYFFDIRFCLFYRIFKIPCPSCGLTRASVLLLQGKVKESLQYNVLAFLFLLIGIFLLILFLIKKLDNFKLFIQKNYIITIILSFVLMIIIFFVNINNPLLY